MELLFKTSSISSAFLQIPAPQFKVLMDSVVWAFKHTMRNVAEIGLNILHNLLQKFAASEEAGTQFFNTYFIDLLQHMFSVVTDTSHTASESLGMNFDLVLLPSISLPMFSPLFPFLFFHLPSPPHFAPPFPPRPTLPLPSLSFPGLTMHATILAYMFSLVEQGHIKAPLTTVQASSNAEYIHQYVSQLLKGAFSHLQE